MKILIVSGQRTGSIVLGQWLAYEKKFRFYNEPKMDNYSEDAVVKKLWSEDLNLEINKWDKIIGLTRDDTYNSAISKIKALSTDKWNSYYDITDDWINENIKEIKETENYMEFVNEQIRNLPIVQVKYENIFIKKNDIKVMTDYLGLNDLKHDGMLDSKFKYRNNKKSFI